MTERPILFSGPMVRAILECRKTQTRRVVKKQPSLGYANTITVEGRGCGFVDGDRVITQYCPYGQTGDRLWVREAWSSERHHSFGPCAVRYKDDGVDAFSLGPCIGKVPGPWKPSIHMPRWASRITLEITGVRVERLQAITAKDILAEGAVLRPHHDSYFGKMPVSAFDEKAYTDLQSLWAAGWDKINAKRAPWSSNPWVWVIEFKKL